MDVLKAYHPLVAGYKGETIKLITKNSGAQIHMPPPARDVDEITISGEKQAVAIAVAQLTAIYEEKKRTCGELTAQVKKSQHKYIIGPKGANLDDIMQRFGVTVELPPPSSDSETITLRGAQPSLVHALTAVYENATSYTTDSVKIPNWLHKHVIGPKGSSLKEITGSYPKVNVKFTEGDIIEMEGPTKDIVQVKDGLMKVATSLIGKMTFQDLRVDPQYHRRLIGKNGAIINKIKSSTGCAVNFPDPSAKTDTDKIRLEGSSEAVAAAQMQIMAIVMKLENTKEVTLDIPARFHALLIGKGGKNIAATVAKCGDVALDFPNSSLNLTKVVVRGDGGAVDACVQHLNASVKILEVENFCVEVPIFKKFHKNIIGKNGAEIKKVKEDLEVRIDVPSSDNDSELIVVTGKRPQVELAVSRLNKIQNAIAAIAFEEVTIAKSLHKFFRGKVTASISQGHGGVTIRFPGPKDDSDIVTVRGPKDDVSAAVIKLKAVAAEHAAGSEVAEVSVPREYHRQLIGKGGAAKNALEAETGCVLIFPDQKDKSDSVTVLGKRTGITKAKAALAARVKVFEDVTEATLDVEPKYHRDLVAQRAAFLDSIKTQFGVDCALPKDKSASIKLKGASAEMPKAIAAIEAFVARLRDAVTIECVIGAQHHRALLGNGGAHIRRLTEELSVKISFPERPKVGSTKKSQPKAESGDKGPVENDADADAAAVAAKKASAETIKITGLEADCNKAAEALQALIPIEATMSIDADYHRFIIGSKGEGIRKIMQDHDVFVKFPASNAKDPTAVVIRGLAENVEKCKEVFGARVTELDSEKEERELRSFKVELEVDPQYHQRLIGKGGSEISKLRDEHGVNINFPDRSKKKNNSNQITVVGLQANAEACGKAIMAKVKEWASLVTITLNLHPGCHSMIIGKGGAEIKRLQTKYNVRINMPRDGGDAVSIVGGEDNAVVCKDLLFDIQDDFLNGGPPKKDDKKPGGGNLMRDRFNDVDDVIAPEEMRYIKPGRFDVKEEREKKEKAKATAFKVSGAPWSASKVSDSKTFPGLGGGSGASAPPTNWTWGKK